MGISDTKRSKSSSPWVWSLVRYAFDLFFFALLRFGLTSYWSSSFPPKSFPNPKSILWTFNTIQQPVQLCQEPLMTLTFAMSLVNFEPKSLRYTNISQHKFHHELPMCVCESWSGFSCPRYFLILQFRKSSLITLLLVTVTITTCSNMFKFKGKHIDLSTSLVLNFSDAECMSPNYCFEIWQGPLPIHSRKSLRWSLWVDLQKLRPGRWATRGRTPIKVVSAVSNRIHGPCHSNYQPAIIT